MGFYGIGILRSKHMNDKQQGRPWAAYVIFSIFAVTAVLFAVGLLLTANVVTADDMRFVVGALFVIAICAVLGIVFYKAGKGNRVSDDMALQAMHNQNAAAQTATDNVKHLIELTSKAIAAVESANSTVMQLQNNRLSETQLIQQMLNVAMSRGLLGTGQQPEALPPGIPLGQTQTQVSAFPINTRELRMEQRADAIDEITNRIEAATVNVRARDGKAMPVRIGFAQSVLDHYPELRTVALEQAGVVQYRLNLTELKSAWVQLGFIGAGQGNGYSYLVGRDRVQKWIDDMRGEVHARMLVGKSDAP